jgi:hypothetical protein
MYVANESWLNGYETFVRKARRKTFYIGELFTYEKMTLKWILDEYVVKWELEWNYSGYDTF